MLSVMPRATLRWLRFSLLRDTGSMMAEEVVQKHLGMDLTFKRFLQQSIDMVKVQIDEFERLLNQED